MICTLEMMAHHLGLASTDDSCVSARVRALGTYPCDSRNSGQCACPSGGRVAEEDGHLLSKCFEAARCLHRLQPPDARTPCAFPAPEAPRSLSVCKSSHIVYVIVHCRIHT